MEFARVDDEKIAFPELAFGRIDLVIDVARDEIKDFIEVVHVLPILVLRGRSPVEFVRKIKIAVDKGKHNLSLFYVSMQGITRFLAFPRRESSEKHQEEQTLLDQVKFLFALLYSFFNLSFIFGCPSLKIGPKTHS